MKPLDKVLCSFAIALVMLHFTNTPTAPIPDNPDVGKGMRVMWVVESRDKVPQYITNQTASSIVREELNSHCAKDNGQPAYRVYDPNTDLSNGPQIWRDLMNSPRASVPWLYVAKGRKLSTGVPPKSIPDLMALLKKYE